MNIYKPSEELLDTLHLAQEKLLRAERHKFIKSAEWRRNTIPDSPGIYALFEKNNKLLYIGESGNLRKRMSEINRTVNHSFRKQIGHQKFNGIKTSKKFNDLVESKLDEYFNDELYVAFIEVFFGRLEIEAFLISNHQQFLINSMSERKLNSVINYLNDFK
ncbi:GIY-YIG nuclease family protein [Algibacter luteus]|uniref:GIY-YIG nuclease family protein n=1 Tax=Algibacter luteus TaxID=1178825 RepID=UPI00259AC3FD|nr:GIY-YIG nuclease family protein [Algibacter luteus]WJJ96511.1 GIY-YIG nuclease family protein [Algibacter luteus]